MPQSKSLMRFRAKLKNRAYQDIKISIAYDFEGKRLYNDKGELFWFVECIEPLLGYEVSFTCTEKQMDEWPAINMERCGCMYKQTYILSGDEYVL